jgi:hypothetical protein
MRDSARREDWNDAVLTDQDSMKELSNHVPRMTSIYKNPKTVVVGPDPRQR